MEALEDNQEKDIHRWQCGLMLGLYVPVPLCGAGGQNPPVTVGDPQRSS